MKSIVVFNNKGGVGKTTLLCNMAAFLSQRKQKKVLVVDADPQCNASIYLFGEDFVISKLSESTISTVYKILQPVRQGKGYIEQNNVPIFHSEGFDVDVILGDTRMSIIEDFLSKEWIDSTTGDPRALKSTFVMKDLLLKLNEKYDYIFFDVGPSLGALNRVILFTSDYFVMPMSSDIFSVKAIDNISTTLKDWQDELEEGLNRYQRKEGEEYAINGERCDIRISFLGYVHQQYTAKMQNDERRPVRAYDRIIRQMPHRINRKFADFFPIGFNPSQLKLGDIPNFNSLIPLSQLSNKPIFGLAGRDGVVGAHFSKVKEYEDVISHVIINALNNIQKYDRVGN